ncbi:hypothetical protein K469DRAFT_695689 [Zopfia rhizophila CBS 207.26]|uniref:Actin-like ATPase domain-containing protein n=1 Tax=Zopfia rhizophila CBS 207.26 TaxID=1314779 RepID=A0A6A6DJ00_9PEZI|nr:hypothetical protein K469DRAFT_695689 [Zopfia rhizophila CBS 207.26]
MRGIQTSRNPRKRRRTQQQLTESTLDSIDDFKIAVDFGATFTTVAFAKPKERNGDETPALYVIDNFPSDPYPDVPNKAGVPTQSWYPPRGRRATRQEKPQTPSLEVEEERRTDKIDDSIFQRGDTIANFNDKVCPGYRSGWEIQEMYKSHDPSVRDAIKGGLVTWLKLQLDSRSLTKELRNELNDVLQNLKDMKLIEKTEDVIRDFLTAILSHTKEELEHSHGLTDHSKIEFIFCVPVAWRTRSRAIMGKAFIEALDKAGFKATNANGRHNVFMVNEAEAAATYALTDRMHELRPNETFILLDCGGGTVDAGTFKVANTYPLRLALQVDHPQGGLCGSSYLNQRYRAMWKERLQRAPYLEQNGQTIDGILDAIIMPEFETRIKKRATLNKGRDPPMIIDIPYLEEDKNTHYLRKGCIVTSHDDLVEVFSPVVKDISALMSDQIRRATEADFEVDKVVLVGGFADSKVLQIFLEAELEKINKANRTAIQIIWSKEKQSSGPAVAKGAILRALDKEHGPKRLPRMSYGVLRHVPYEPQIARRDPKLKHLLAWKYKPKTNDIDGREYIHNVIEWPIKRVEKHRGEKSQNQRNEDECKLKPVHLERFDSTHLFSASKRKWVCEEIIYESPRCVKDNYLKDDWENKEAEELGRVEFDLTHLKKQGLIQKQGPASEEGMTHYEVTFQVDMVVIDRDLKFSARWPADETGGVIEGSQRTFSIVTAFDPGTGPE